MNSDQPTILEKFFDSLKEKDSLLIIAHDHPDPDSISSAAALQFLAKVFGVKKTTIAYGGIIGRSENAHMVKYLKLKLRKLDRVKVKDYTKIAMVDTQPQTGNNSLPKRRVPDLVLDHHPVIAPTRKVPFVDVRLDYGATATIMAEYLYHFDLEIAPRLATALLYGIRSETQDLGREARKVDMDHYMKLLPIADRRVLAKIVNSRVSRNYFRWLRNAIQNARLVGNAVVTRMGVVDNPDVIPEIADLMLRLEGATWVLSMGQYENAIHLSIRTTNVRKNAGSLMKRLLRGKGMGGGHGLMAGGKVETPGLEAWKVHELEDSIEQSFLKAIRRQDRQAIPLLMNEEDEKAKKSRALTVVK